MTLSKLFTPMSTVNIKNNLSSIIRRLYVCRCECNHRSTITLVIDNRPQWSTICGLKTEEREMYTLPILQCRMAPYITLTVHWTGSAVQDVSIHLISDKISSVRVIWTGLYNFNSISNKKTLGASEQSLWLQDSFSKLTESNLQLHNVPYYQYQYFANVLN